MSDFQPHKLEEVVPGERDFIHGGIPDTAMYSVSLQNETPDVNPDFNAYYICTKGMGYSIEIKGKLEIGKFTEEDLREKLEGRVFIESSIRNRLTYSSGLRNICKLGWDIGVMDGQWLLIAKEPGKNDDITSRPGKVFKVWNLDETIRPLATILHWEEHGSHRVCDMTEEGLKEFREVHKELHHEEWPAPGESIVLLFHGEKVHVTHNDHVNLINPDFFKTGLEED